MDETVPPVAYAISDMLRRKKSIPPEMVVELLGAILNRHATALANLERIGRATPVVLEDFRAAVASIKAALFGASS